MIIKRYSLAVPETRLYVPVLDGVTGHALTRRATELGSRLCSRCKAASNTLLHLPIPRYAAHETNASMQAVTYTNANKPYLASDGRRLLYVTCL